jgi:hypothetical protein
VKCSENAQKLALSGHDVQNPGKVFQTPCLTVFDPDLLPILAILAEFSRQRKFPQARSGPKVTLKQGIKPRSKPNLLVDRGQK